MKILTLEKLAYLWSKLKKRIDNKANLSHTHTKNQITDFPIIPTKTSQLTNDSITANSIGLGNANNTADSVKNVNSAGLIRVPRIKKDLNFSPGGNVGCLEEIEYSSPNLPSQTWFHVFTSQGSDPNCEIQIALRMTGGNDIYMRRKDGGQWSSWTRFLHDSNFTDYALSKNGGCVYGDMEVKGYFIPAAIKIPDGMYIVNKDNHARLFIQNITINSVDKTNITPMDNVNLGMWDAIFNLMACKNYVFPQQGGSFSVYEGENQFPFLNVITDKQNIGTIKIVPNGNYDVDIGTENNKIMFLYASNAYLDSIVGKMNGEFYGIHMNYAVCNSGGADKTVTIPTDVEDFVLKEGTTIKIKFAFIVNTNNTTLNVNNTGAKPIKTGISSLAPGLLTNSKIYEFMYDGSAWQLVGNVYGLATIWDEGLMPSYPSSDRTSKFLRGDGTWAAPSLATTSSNGLLRALPQLNREDYYLNGNNTWEKISNINKSGYYSFSKGSDYLLFQIDFSEVSATDYMNCPYYTAEISLLENTSLYGTLMIELGAKISGGVVELFDSTYEWKSAKGIDERIGVIYQVAYQGEHSLTINAYLKCTDDSTATFEGKYRVINEFENSRDDSYILVTY